MQLQCPWANRYAVLTNILRYAPAWPYHSEPIAYAVDGGIANAGGANRVDGSGLNYAEAILDIRFETVSRSEGGTVYDESIEPTAELLTIAHNDFRWGSAGGTPLLPAEAQNRLELEIDYNVTLYNLTSIPGAVLTLRGKSNSGNYVAESGADVWD